MNYSEIANIAVSIVSVGIALVALFQTKRQIALSNKQQLFDRRLSCFLEFNTIYNLYVANKLYLKDDSTFYHTNDLIFSWLTNCADLEEMVLAVSNPLQQKEQKTLLTKYEQLKNDLRKNYNDTAISLEKEQDKIEKEMTLVLENITKKLT